MTDNGILARCLYALERDKYISRTNVKSLIHFAKIQKTEIKRLKAEVERLNAVSEICGECHKQYAKKIEQAKSEAMEDLAVKIKKELINEAKNRESCEQCQRDIATLEALELVDRVLRETIKERFHQEKE